MICAFDECIRPVKARGFCAGHYRQVWAGEELRSLGTRPRRVGCQVDACSEPHRARGYCRTHYRRVRRHGDPSVKLRHGGPMRGDFPTYPTIHTRLMKVRGRAAEHACVDCGGNAHEWSYNNASSDERTYVDHGQEVRYSLSLDDYDPRCRSCHRKFDGAARDVVSARSGTSR